MLECLIIGDSIAVGTHMFRPECVAYAKGGITSHGWNKKYANESLKAGTTIISLSTNDWEKASTYATLLDIRKRVTAGKVYWIVPNKDSKPKAAAIVKQIANEFGDNLVYTTRWQADKIHPSWAGYKHIADTTK